MSCDWQRSSFSGDGGNNCVEVAAVTHGLALRESEGPDALLVVDRAAFRALLAGVKAGRFDCLPR